MKKYGILLLALLFFTAVSAPACSRKSGCPMNESLKPGTNKKGEFKTAKHHHKSGLFPKKMSKKMR